MTVHLGQPYGLLSKGRYRFSTRRRVHLAAWSSETPSLRPASGHPGDMRAGPVGSVGPLAT
jgi:hypothetical protein